MNSAKKIVYAILFDSTDTSQIGPKFNLKLYCDIVLQKCKRSPPTGYKKVRLLHDNATEHTKYYSYTISEVGERCYATTSITIFEALGTRYIIIFV